MALPLLDLSIAGVKLATSDGSQADVRRIAAQWIADNRPLIDPWLVAAESVIGNGFDDFGFGGCISLSECLPGE